MGDVLATQDDQLARAQLAQAPAALDGTVIQVNVRAGETVSPGQTLLIIADLETLRVEANIEETNIGRIKAGQPVDVYVDAYPAKPLSGEVSQVGLAADPVFGLFSGDNPGGGSAKTVQRVPMRVKLKELDGALRPGMSARIRAHVE